MKQISARQFRLTFQELTEPVTVILRDKAGNYQVVGEWTPRSVGLPPSSYEPSVIPRGFGSPKPAPKAKR